MTKTIYVVCADFGAYSDRADWRVRAFESKERAEDFCQAAQKEANDLTEVGKNLSYEERGRLKSRFDPTFRCDGYDTTDYKVEELELEMAE